MELSTRFRTGAVDACIAIVIRWRAPIVQEYGTLKAGLPGLAADGDDSGTGVSSTLVRVSKWFAILSTLEQRSINTVYKTIKNYL
jgi:hypothetical protein